MWDRASVGDTDTVWGTGEVLGCREHRARIGTKEELQRQGVWGIETVWGTEGQWGPWWCVCVDGAQKHATRSQLMDRGALITGCVVGQWT